jgi:hypothetical protein
VRAPTPRPEGKRNGCPSSRVSAVFAPRYRHASNAEDQQQDDTETADPQPSEDAAIIDAACRIETIAEQL